eukprot:3909956-Rhodomonas_salina.2
MVQERKIKTGRYKAKRECRARETERETREKQERKRGGGERERERTPAHERERGREGEHARSAQLEGGGRCRRRTLLLPPVTWPAHTLCQYRTPHSTRVPLYNTQQYLHLPPRLQRVHAVRCPDLVGRYARSVPDIAAQSGRPIC